MACFILVGEIQSFGILRCYLAEKQDFVVSAQFLMTQVSDLDFMPFERML